MNAKVLLICCGSCVIIPVLLYILFMSLTVLLSKNGFQSWFENDHDDRRGIKPRSLSHFVSEEMPFLGLKRGNITLRWSLRNGALQRFPKPCFLIYGEELWSNTSRFQ